MLFLSHTNLGERNLEDSGWGQLGDGERKATATNRNYGNTEYTPRRRSSETRPTATYDDRRQGKLWCALASY